MKISKVEFKKIIKECIKEVLAESKSQDPDREEMIGYLSSLPHAHEDGFKDDVEVAMYWYAHDHHAGQASNLYSVLSTSPYSPGPMRNSVEGEGGLAEMLYDELVHHFGGIPIERGEEV